VRKHQFVKGLPDPQALDRPLPHGAFFKQCEPKGWPPDLLPYHPQPLVRTNPSHVYDSRGVAGQAKKTPAAAINFTI